MMDLTSPQHKVGSVLPEGGCLLSRGSELILADTSIELTVKSLKPSLTFLSKRSQPTRSRISSRLWLRRRRRAAVEQQRLLLKASSHRHKASQGVRYWRGRRRPLMIKSAAGPSSSGSPVPSDLSPAAWRPQRAVWSARRLVRRNDVCSAGTLAVAVQPVRPSSFRQEADLVTSACLL